MTSSPDTYDNDRQLPIRLIVELADQTIRIQVIGGSMVRYEAAFTLDVVADGNHTLHNGSTVLDGGHVVILSTVNVGYVTGRPWSAHLLVEPLGEKSYEQFEASS